MFTLETRALRRASRELIRHGLDVDHRLQVPLPDTGRSGSATQDGLERVLGGALDELAGAVARAGDFTATQATLSPDHFDGWAADAYRLNAGGLTGRERSCASACRGLAAALGILAAALDVVRLALRRMRALARQHLVVEGEEIRPPGPDAPDVQHQVFQMVEHAVHQARRLEHQAHCDWQSAPALLATIAWELSDGPR